jgi:hypothetical protein
MSAFQTRHFLTLKYTAKYTYNVHTSDVHIHNIPMELLSDFDMYMTTCISLWQLWQFKLRLESEIFLNSQKWARLSLIAPEQLMKKK